MISFNLASQLVPSFYKLLLCQAGLKKMVSKLKEFGCYSKFTRSLTAMYFISKPSELIWTSFITSEYETAD